MKVQVANGFVKNWLSWYGDQKTGNNRVKYTDSPQKFPPVFFHCMQSKIPFSGGQINRAKGNEIINKIVLR